MQQWNPAEKLNQDGSSTDGCLSVLLVLLAATLLFTLLPPQPVSAACGNWGTVTNVTPYPRGGYWIAVHVAGPDAAAGYWTSFPSARRFTAGQSVYVAGCPDAAKYVTRPWVWR